MWNLDTLNMPDSTANIQPWTMCTESSAEIRFHMSPLCVYISHQYPVAYLGFHKGRPNYSLATDAVCKGGHQTMFSYFFPMANNWFLLPKGSHGIMAPLNMPLSSSCVHSSLYLYGSPELTFQINYYQYLYGSPELTFQINYHPYSSPSVVWGSSVGGLVLITLFVIIVHLREFISKFLTGMQQQGIFRIPGSQYEINELKELFESGSSVFLFGLFLVQRVWVFE